MHIRILPKINYLERLKISFPSEHCFTYNDNEKIGNKDDLITSQEAARFFLIDNVSHSFKYHEFHQDKYSDFIVIAQCGDDGWADLQATN